MDDKVIGGKAKELSGTRRILPMNTDFTVCCDRSIVEDLDSDLGMERSTDNCHRKE